MRLTDRLICLCSGTVTTRSVIVVDSRPQKLFSSGLLLLVLSGIGTHSARSQTANTKALRSEDAVSFLRSSLQAMHDNSISNSDFQCIAQGSKVTSEQGTQPNQSVQSQWQRPLHQVLMLSGASMQQSSATAVTPEDLRMLQIRGSNASLQAWMEFPQYALSRLLLDTSYSLAIRKIKDGTTVLTTFKTVQGTPITVTKQVWNFPSSGLLPTKVAYSLPNPRSPSFSLQRSIDYGEFEQFSGIMSPRQYVIHTVANPDEQVSVSELQCTPSTSKSN